MGLVLVQPISFVRVSNLSVNVIKLAFLIIIEMKDYFITKICLLAATLVLISSDVQADKLKYLSSLLLQKQNIQTLTNDMINLENNLTQNLALSNNQNYQSNLLLNSIINQQKFIMQAYSNTFLPISSKTWECENDTSEDKLLISTKIQSLDQLITDNDKVINGLQSCLKNDQLKIQYQFYNRTVQGLKRSMLGSCEMGHVIVIPATNIPFLDIGSTKFVPSSTTSLPFVYGNLTSENYQSKVSQLVTLYGSKQCPSDQPFLNSSYLCSQCKIDEIYDLSQLNCTICPFGTIYEVTSHSCTSKITILNSNVANSNNYIGLLPSRKQGVQSCPIDKPFFDGSYCISCALPLFFNFTKNQCQNCGSGQIFSSISRGCTDNSFYASNLTNLTNYIGIQLTPSEFDNVKTCPSQTPFSNGTKCFQCKLPYFFDFYQMNCIKCPQNYSFNITIQLCQGSSGFNNSNIIKSKNFIGHVPLYNTLFGNCPENTPFFNGLACTKCNYPQYFNFDSLTCQFCRKGLSFNIEIQLCEFDKQDYYTNLDNQNIYYNGNFQNINTFIKDKKNFNKNSQECPIEQPFYNSNQNICILCPTTQPLFDLKNNKCIQCPEGSHFNKDSHNCLTQMISATIQRMIMNTK